MKRIVLIQVIFCISLFAMAQTAKTEQVDGVYYMLWSTYAWVTKRPEALNLTTVRLTSLNKSVMRVKYIRWTQSVGRLLTIVPNWRQYICPIRSRESLDTPSIAVLRSRRSISLNRWRKSKGSRSGNVMPCRTLRFLLLSRRCRLLLSGIVKGFRWWTACDMPTIIWLRATDSKPVTMWKKERGG